jgi:hypothetical protein
MLTCLQRFAMGHAPVISRVCDKQGLNQHGNVHMHHSLLAAVDRHPEPPCRDRRAAFARSNAARGPLLPPAPCGPACHAVVQEPVQISLILHQKPALPPVCSHDSSHVIISEQSYVSAEASDWGARPLPPAPAATWRHSGECSAMLAPTGARLPGMLQCCTEEVRHGTACSCPASLSAAGRVLMPPRCTHTPWLHQLGAGQREAPAVTRQQLLHGGGQPPGRQDACPGGPQDHACQPARGHVHHPHLPAAGGVASRGAGQRKAEVEGWCSDSGSCSRLPCDTAMQRHPCV